MVLGIEHNMNQQMFKRNPSAHQKQMRFLAIFFVTLFLVIFTFAFYFVARWLDTNHGAG